MVCLPSPPVSPRPNFDMPTPRVPMPQAGGITLPNGDADADTAPHSLPQTIAHTRRQLALIHDARTELELHLVPGPAAHNHPLSGIADESDLLAAVVNLIGDAPALQTRDTGAKLRDMMLFAVKLSSSMLIMVAESRRRPQTGEAGVDWGGSGVALEPGGREYNHLQGMLRPFRVLRRQLEAAVSGVCVGLRGDVSEGFSVSRGVLEGVNERVRGVLGADLVLVEKLRHRLQGQPDGLIRLDDSEAALLGLPQTTSTRVEQWRAGVSN